MVSAAFANSPFGGASSGFGAQLPRTAWIALLRAGAARRFEAYELLMRQGEPGTHVLVLTAGRVKVTRLERDGSEYLLAIRGPGEVIGLIAVMDGRGRSATVTAVERCLTYILPAERFRRIVRDFQLQDLLLKHVLARYREGEDIRAELAELPALQRVTRVLLRCVVSCMETGDPLRSSDVGLSQHELARSVGLSRSAVAAELSWLRQRGLISTGRRRIEIRDINVLRRISTAGAGEGRCCDR